MLIQVLYARDSSEGFSPSQVMLQHSLDQSFRNLMQIFCTLLLSKPQDALEHIYS